MTTDIPRDNIPKPPQSDVFTASVEEVEADLMHSFRQSATFRLFEPSETINKKTQLSFRHKYVSPSSDLIRVKTKELFRCYPNLFPADLVVIHKPISKADIAVNKR